jgi:hypothetical protein
MHDGAALAAVKVRQVRALVTALRQSVLDVTGVLAMNKMQELARQFSTLALFRLSLAPDPPLLRPVYDRHARPSCIIISTL